MSKFVTYPAVTVLDNDHSLLIDSPNAGTNSITANNAANTLLSKWAGFETFEEAVQNTISNNQEFIDRDAAIRSETADLKRKIVTTFPAKEASGQIATFESEFEDAPLKSCIVQVEPVQDLHGYDHPWPAGGGKNKLEVTSTSATQNGVTITVNSDGTISLSGTATDQIIFGVGSVALSGKYILSGCPSGGSYSTYFLFCVSYDYGSGATVTFDGTSKSVQIYVRSGVNTNGLVFKPMIRLASDTDATYSPYSNICPISGFTGCEVQRTGVNVNVWDEEWEVGDLSNSGQPITASDRIRTKNFIHVIPNTAYYFKTGVNGQTSWQLFGCYYDKDKNFISTFYRRNSSLTMPSNCHYIKWTTTGGYGTTYNHDISINYPATDHDYHPYVGQTYPITFPSEAGTVYGGTLDVTKGELVVDRAMVELPSDMSWATWGVNYQTSGITGFYIYRYNMPSTLDFSNIGKAVLTNLLAINNFVWGGSDVGYKTDTGGTSSNWYEIVSINNETASILSTDTYAEAIEKFKAFLESTPLNVLYKLLEPIHYPLTPTEIKTLLGQNNLWANTGDVSVEYLMSDVGWYVEKKLRAFQSILAGVEDSAVASKNYSTDSYLIFNNDIYRVTKTITAGETIEDGVNVTKTTVAEQLMALAQV